MKYGADIPNVWLPGLYELSVLVNPRYSFAVNVKFVDSPILLRTAREDENGKANDFFNATPATREEKRNKYVKHLQSEVVPFWRRAGIDLYFTAEPSQTDLVVPMDSNNGFFAAKDFVKGQFQISDEARQLFKDPKIVHNAINVVLVKKLTYSDGFSDWSDNPGFHYRGFMNTGAATSLIVISDKMPDFSNPTVTLPASPMVIAHEIGHALSLEHPSAGDLGAGSINDLSKILGATDALKYLLMTAGDEGLLMDPNPAVPEITYVGLLLQKHASQARWFGRWKSNWKYAARTD